MRLSAHRRNGAEVWTSWGCMYLVMVFTWIRESIITVKCPEHCALWTRRTYSSSLKLFSSVFTLHQKKAVTHRDVKSKAKQSPWTSPLIYVTAMKHQIIDRLSMKPVVCNYLNTVRWGEEVRNRNETWWTKFKKEVTHQCRTPPPDLWPSAPGASWTVGPCRPRRSRRATDCSRRTRTLRRPGPGPDTAGSICRRSLWTSSWLALWAEYSESEIRTDVQTRTWRRCVVMQP